MYLLSCILHLIYYCQAQLQLSAKLKAEFVLFPLNPAIYPSPPVKVYFSVVTNFESTVNYTTQCQPNLASP